MGKMLDKFKDDPEFIAAMESTNPIATIQGCAEAWRKFVESMVDTNEEEEMVRKVVETTDRIIAMFEYMGWDITIPVVYAFILGDETDRRLRETVLEANPVMAQMQHMVDSMNYSYKIPLARLVVGDLANRIEAGTL